MKFSHDVKKTVYGNIGIICPHCMGYQIDLVNGMELLPEPAKWTVCCPECGKEFKMYALNALDPNITRTISVLNKKGYKTKFSCEGHFDVSDMSEPYIIIKGDAEEIFKENPLPELWFLDDVRMFSGCFTIRSDRSMAKNDEDWDKRCDVIEAWAESLPEQPGEHSFSYGYNIG